MTGAMYAAISGLKSHMNKLNVIGNNIANVNTNGYKTGRVVFTTALYTTMRSGSNGTEATGGRNPAQIGYGNQIGTIDLDMSTGNYSPTGRGMDCMIDGDGFFLVSSKDTAKNIKADNPESIKGLSLTRVGNFTFGPDGYLVDGAGNTVYGFMNSVATADDPVSSAKISDQLVPIRLPRIFTNEQGEKTVRYAVAEDGQNLTDNIGEEDNPNPFASVDSISIDEKTGKITGICKDNNEPITIGYLAIGNVTNPNGVTQESGSYYHAGEGAGAMSITLMGGAEREIRNGQADYFTHVNGSLGGGDAAEGMRISSAGTTGLITGGLEMSKTDLATEIAEMITTQRGYQANTRIITVTDSMLEELVNIKR